MKTGYARCSTNESKQDIERQVRELKQAGAERVFLEYEHGDAVIKEQLTPFFGRFFCAYCICHYIPPKKSFTICSFLSFSIITP